ncbi:hypothetical protein BX611_2968 [Lutibacter oceani]|uniref:Uncharacterized protein n=1 Tax=Lutibacter oceani TaxID=1853311 RepID=A0A3D9RQ16_9FLAO|nr:hypothetical protein [Lutibacter oceani]REE78833.1 hypothetical protein BX611_2968 [Lutibacter oceani]
MKKKELIDYINKNYQASLDSRNTSFSKINSSKDVWWYNVPVSKFTDDVHLLLNTQQYALWIVLPKGFAKGFPFKIREDKNAVDLEISADKNYMYLRDVKSGGTGFNFTEFVKEKINF